MELKAILSKAKESFVKQIGGQQDNCSAETNDDRIRNTAEPSGNKANIFRGLNLLISKKKAKNSMKSQGSTLDQLRNKVLLRTHPIVDDELMKNRDIANNSMFSRRELIQDNSQFSYPQHYALDSEYESIGSQESGHTRRPPSSKSSSARNSRYQPSISNSQHSNRSSTSRRLSLLDVKLESNVADVYSEYGQSDGNDEGLDCQGLYDDDDDDANGNYNPDINSTKDFHDLNSLSQRLSGHSQGSNKRPIMYSGDVSKTRYKSSTPTVVVEGFDDDLSPIQAGPLSELAAKNAKLLRMKALSVHGSERVGFGSSSAYASNGQYRLESQANSSQKTQDLSDVEEAKSIINIGLFGCSNSGKTTLVKQLKLIYDTRFGNELPSQRDLIHQQVFNSLLDGVIKVLRFMQIQKEEQCPDQWADKAGQFIQVITDLLGQLSGNGSDMEFEYYDESSSSYMNSYHRKSSSSDAKMSMSSSGRDTEIKQELANIVSQLKQDSSFQSCLERSSEFNLEDSILEFLERSDEIICGDSSHIGAVQSPSPLSPRSPSNQKNLTPLDDMPQLERDFLLVRSGTLSVYEEFEFDVPSANSCNTRLRVLDFGGYRYLRLKWSQAIQRLGSLQASPWQQVEQEDQIPIQESAENFEEIPSIFFYLHSLPCYNQRVEEDETTGQFDESIDQFERLLTDVISMKLEHANQKKSTYFVLLLNKKDLLRGNEGKLAKFPLSSSFTDFRQFAKRSNRASKSLKATMKQLTDNRSNLIDNEDEHSSETLLGMRYMEWRFIERFQAVIQSFAGAASGNKRPSTTIKANGGISTRKPKILEDKFKFFVYRTDLLERQATRLLIQELLAEIRKA